VNANGGGAVLWRWRAVFDGKGVLGLLAATGVLGALLLPRVAQPPAYHAFADARPLGPIPNAGDVLSNLAFVAAGLFGLATLGAGAARFAHPRERAPWALFFASVALVGPGSAWYHAAPSNATLVWDRLPMAVAFAALLVAALAERVGPAAARLLLPLAVASAATVPYWAATEAAGRGDLRPYLLVQLAPLVAIPVLLARFPPRHTLGRLWLAGIGLYGVAKGAELGDAALLGITGVMSGHTLKHLLAAAGTGLLAWMLRARRALP
jgi:hypothetical protein